MKVYLTFAILLLFAACKKNDNVCKMGDAKIAMYSYLINHDPGNTMHIEIAIKDCDGNIISTLDSAKIKNGNIGDLYWIRDQPTYPQSWFIADSCTPTMSQCDFTIYWHEETNRGNIPHYNTFTLTPQNWQ